MNWEARRTWMWAGAAALVAVGAFRLAGDTPGPDAAAAPRVAVRDGGGRASLWVHVAGAVRRPGLYRVRPESRIGEAVERAGGPVGKADLSGVNLAARVEDGQQVLVPRRGQGTAAIAAAPAGSVGGAEAGAGGSEQISLAGATVEQLDALDGIGPTLASRIIEYREQHGGISSVDELSEVDGIGETRLEALRQGLRP